MSSNNKEVLKHLDDFMQNTDSFENVSIVDYLIRNHGFKSTRVDDVIKAKKLALDIVEEGKRLKYLMPAKRDSWYVNLTDLGRKVLFAGGHFGYLRELKEKNKKPWSFYTTLVSLAVVIIFGVINIRQNNDRKDLEAEIETCQSDNANQVKHIESLQYINANHEKVIESLDNRIEQLNIKDTIY